MAPKKEKAPPPSSKPVKSGGGKQKKKKWSKGKQKEKVYNMVLFDKATYDKLLTEAPKFKLITPSILSDRLRVMNKFFCKSYMHCSFDSCFFVKRSSFVVTMRRRSNNDKKHRCLFVNTISPPFVPSFNRRCSHVSAQPITSPKSSPASALITSAKATAQAPEVAFAKALGIANEYGGECVYSSPKATAQAPEVAFAKALGIANEYGGECVYSSPKATAQAPEVAFAKALGIANEYGGENGAKESKRRRCMKRHVMREWAGPNPTSLGPAARPGQIPHQRADTSPEE
ncbi:hypothetical protein SSX86_023097 [Deinandra increscens subsp. villosa]|uniref:40S ribosomal protein S25 n=1 Tax=Deinandra increscens subsp. villosa TaxID=3103831 RepID=A0AAP0GRS6_9ASTR